MRPNVISASCRILFGSRAPVDGGRERASRNSTSFEREWQMDFASVFGNIMDMVRDNILLTIGYGILGLVAAAALVILAKEGFGLAFTQDTPERREKMKNCVYVLAICLILAFLPAIINGVIALAGTATNLGQSLLTI